MTDSFGVLSVEAETYTMSVYSRYAGGDRLQREQVYWRYEQQGST